MHECRRDFADQRKSSSALGLTSFERTQSLGDARWKSDVFVDPVSRRHNRVPLIVFNIFCLQQILIQHFLQLK